MKRLLEEKVTALHGAGGLVMDKLLRERILPKFPIRAAGPIGLDQMDDGAVLDLPPGRLVFTTDSHVVKPLFFPGGDIGKLAVTGTVNDLVVMGARPVALSLALVIEEGFPLADLERILESAAAVLGELGVALVTGDTKVMGKGELDGLVITTTGVGVAERVVPDSGVRPGDFLLVTGPVGEHGLAILAARNALPVETPVESDVAPLWPALAAALATGGITAMKDPTRGGLAAALNEMAQKSGVGMEIEEERIPVRAEVRGLCELLGISPYELACEGRAVLAVAPEKLAEVLSALRAHPLTQGAQVIGRATEHYPGKVILRTAVGGKRFLEMPLGDPVPRIC
ncbi:MAG: hydrogenase expression/formation protein HypE [Candidatus Bipolaricaulota bacterium]|nr:hydrogenase expression/formation protein HypE [Candidatus Bipolaricaulota bacterium]